MAMFYYQAMFNKMLTELHASFTNDAFVLCVSCLNKPNLHKPPVIHYTHVAHLLS